jgi:hypothetical protein
MIDIPQSLLIHISKVKDTTGKNLRTFWWRWFSRRNC